MIAVMAELVADCPRCGANSHTFEVLAVNYLDSRHGWQKWYEAFCICKNCRKGTTFVIAGDVHADGDLREADPMKMTVAVNRGYTVERFISLIDEVQHQPPEHVPPEIEAAFKEAATCVATECWNAAGAMFRLCLDLATRPLLPEEPAEGLNEKTRRDLGLRLPWLFDNGRLPGDLRSLSACVHQDGNDAAHAGTLARADAEDLLDFAIALLERIYTEPARLELAQARREERRKPKAK